MLFGTETTSQSVMPMTFGELLIGGLVFEFLAKVSYVTVAAMHCE